MSAKTLDELAASVDDWAPLPASEATWLTDTPLPDRWQTIPIVEDSPVPLRVAAVATRDREQWGTACQALSAFRFTGDPPTDLVYDNNDRALRAFSAGGIRTDEIVLPKQHGLAGVRSSGLVEIGDDRLRVRYSTYLRGSNEPLQGLVVEEITAATSEAYIRLGTDLGALSSTTEEAFMRRVGVTMQDMETAEATHAERVRADAAATASQTPALSDEQRRFLSTALAMWGGVASWRTLPITTFGYTDWAEFDVDVARMRAELDYAEPGFSAVEWTRVLLLAEISFASDLLGAGGEFDIVTTWRDPEALPVLRSIQRSLAGTVDASLLFPNAGRRRPAQ